MNKCIFLILTLLSIRLSGQNVFDVNQIVCIDTSEFKALPNLDKDLSKARVVLIGEAGHGDGKTFETKEKLIKYLVKKHGFNTIALEGAGFIETPFALASLKRDSNTYKEFEKCLDLKWSTSQQMKGLIDFITTKYKNNQINIYGFDPQPNSTSYTDKLFDFLADSSVKCLSNIDKTVFAEYLTKLRSYYKQSTGQEEFTLSFEEIKTLDSLTSIYIYQSKLECSLVKQTLINVQSCVRLFIYNMEEMGYSDRSVNSRDSVMALNIFYYLDKNPQAKMIVSAANFHIIKDLSLITNNYDSLKYKKIIPMGYFISRKYESSSFTIAFTNGGGQNGYCTDTAVYDVIKTAKFPIDINTLEFTFKNKKCEMAYVNLRRTESKVERQTRSLIFGGNMHYGYWDKAFDCIFYIDKQKPSTYRLP